MTIPGIGSAAASAIVEHREAFGPYHDLYELDYVDGVGPQTMEVLREYVFIDSCNIDPADTLHWLSQVDSLVPCLSVYYLDVGQGDAIFVQAEGGMSMLFDGGPDNGGPLEPTVVHRLNELGVDTIDIVAFSHPHSDHVGGLAAVVRNFQVLSVLDPGMEFSSWLYQDLLQAASDEGCDYGLLSGGMEFRLSESVTATVVSTGSSEVNLNLNENSAVLRIQCGDFSTLLTGDIEEGTEMELTQSAMPVTVLKVPHHGSLTSVFPPYLRKLSPQVAVFSAGRDNPFGHPHPRVIEIYTEMGCGILRTDTQGTIVVQTDGEVFSISAIMAEFEPEEYSGN